MKRTLVLALASLLIAGTAQAQSRPGETVRPFFGMGLTFGGDRLEEFDFSNGTSSTVRTGGIIHLQAGVDVALGGPISMQANIGYHADSANGSNGDYEFTRMPVELLAFVSLTDSFRLGGGVRHAFDAQVNSSGAVGGFDSDFKARTGIVVEGEYFFAERVSVKVRAVSEKFEGKSGVYRGRTFDATHGGVYGSFYFF